MQRKEVGTVAKDIYHVLNAELEHQPDTALAAGYAMRIGGEFAKATMLRNKPREKGRLWASDLGKKCHRQMWYQFNQPSKGEPFTGNTKFKFLYGNMLEEAVLYFTEEAGHTVSHQQHTVEWQMNGDWKVRGRIDALIDGVLVDVKSTSSFGFQRYKTGIDATNDSFGYLQQVGYYKHFGDYGQPVGDQGFLWIDKQNGHIMYTHAPIDSKATLEGRAIGLVDSIEKPSEGMVPKAFSPEPYGKSGNLCLPMPCSYCSFKEHCYRDANGGHGLRTFAYNHKPVFFTEVAREPRVPEIKQ